MRFHGTKSLEANSIAGFSSRRKFTRPAKETVWKRLFHASFKQMASSSTSSGIIPIVVLPNGYFYLYDLTPINGAHL
jgi:hypothetical protein